MNCLPGIGQFPHLRYVFVFDSGDEDERRTTIQTFAESIRCLPNREGARDIRVRFNWDNL
jgi:hypothetical protein